MCTILAPTTYNLKPYLRGLLEFSIFSAEFDNERMNRTENLYKAFSALQDFCCFDYYVLLKKFTNSIQEYNFNTVPNFEKINGEYITDDLKDFCAAA